LQKVAFQVAKKIMKKKSENNPICTMCSQEIKVPEPFIFHINDERCFFCDSCAEPFKAGLSLGQLEINSKLISFISDLPDSDMKSEIKKAIFFLTPLSNRAQHLEQKPEKLVIENDIHTPGQLFNEISKAVIGQDLAKKAISVSMINHIQSIEDFDVVTHADKHHVLMLGKSGSGKTLIANTVADLFDLPFAIGDATSYSPTGFQGSDADSVVSELLLETDMDFDRAERGIVFIDEIDKICSSNKGSGRYESFIGSTQSTLLKLVEGKIVKIPGQLFGEMPGSSFNIDSSRMLFFFGGAFNGLSDILAKKMGKKDRSIGFIKNNDGRNDEIDEALRSYEIFSQASREEMVESLIEFGMLSELVGRIPTIVALKPLSKEDLMSVLINSSTSPIKKQKSIFAKSGYNLDFADEFLIDLVDKSYHSAVGTRALDSYVKQALNQASFDLLTLKKSTTSSGKVTITSQCLQDPGKYELSKPKLLSVSADQATI
jgi:ATP-dependent Clp protease ATP-binding subunit ClpX